MRSLDHIMIFSLLKAGDSIEIASPVDSVVCVPSPLHTSLQQNLDIFNCVKTMPRMVTIT